VVRNDNMTTEPTDGGNVYDREEHLAQQEAESNSMWEERKKEKAARKAAEDDEKKAAESLSAQQNEAVDMNGNKQEPEEPAEYSEPEKDTTTKTPTSGKYVYDREEHLAQQEAESNSMWEERKKEKAARKAAKEEGWTPPTKKPLRIKEKEEN
jgi:hypothetical protein